MSRPADRFSHGTFPVVCGGARSVPKPFVSATHLGASWPLFSVVVAQRRLASRGDDLISRTAPISPLCVVAGPR